MERNLSLDSLPALKSRLRRLWRQYNNYRAVSPINRRTMQIAHQIDAVAWEIKCRTSAAAAAVQIADEREDGGAR
jgi:hypothetical protein